MARGAWVRAGAALTLKSVQPNASIKSAYRKTDIGACVRAYVRALQTKPMSTMLCGSTIEFEMALLTLIFLAGEQVHV